MSLNILLSTNRLCRGHFWIGICLLVGILKLVSAVEKSDDFEIRTLTGEPNYKSVNLTWAVEPGLSASSEDNSNFLPKSFTIFYCELQSFGPHRCRSKLVEENEINEDDEQSTKYFSTTIDNLRMATKYSFHIKPPTKKGVQKVSGRSETLDNEVEPESRFNGQTIVIPTKGFSAQATRCLPQASEIEVETGPYFGGKIVVDGGNCGIQGNPKDARDKYVMRIDHEKCGSIVKPEANTVETFVTVQENLGIFTHSTRRFVVVCTFQSGIQTVRASFTVPGKGGVAPVPNDADMSSERNGRERQFRMVDKSALVLKEPSYSEDSRNDTEDVENSVATIESIRHVTSDEENKEKITIENLIHEGNPKMENYGRANFARLVDKENDEKNIPSVGINTTYIGLVIAVTLTVILVGVFIYILQRELRRKTSSSGLPKHKTITNP